MHYKVRNSSMSSGIFLIGLGVLAYSGWWWPGILLVVGLSSSAALIMRGKYVPALLTFGFFAVIPLLVTADIPWSILGPFILIAMGAVVIVKSFSKPRNQNNQSME